VPCLSHAFGTGRVADHRATGRSNHRPHTLTAAHGVGERARTVSGHRVRLSWSRLGLDHSGTTRGDPEVPVGCRLVLLASAVS
jgi:hypothetical protein